MRDPVDYIEIIPGRLYFYIIKDTEWAPLKNTEEYHFFCTDCVFKYVNFHEDFGPLNLACIYKYSILLNRKQKMKSMSRKKIVHYTVCNVPNDSTHYKINAAFLMGTYMISHLKKNAQEVYYILSNNGLEDFEYFRDASAGLCKYQLSLLDCLEGFEKALNVGIFDFDSFDPEYYSHYEKVENGDMNWIVPDKMMAFCSPHLCSKIDRGVALHGPELYIEHFKKANINVVVRLNNKTYESNSFKKAGFQHHDLYFPDGSTPSVCLVERFLKICREAEAKGVAVAVHCKAGLGRTGTLISCYLMDKYGMTAKQSIAWTRIARPGSVMGVQQNFLEKMESSLLRKEEKLSLSLSCPPSPQVDLNNEASPEKKSSSSTSSPPSSLPPCVATTTDHNTTTCTTTTCISDIENGLSDIALDRNKTAHILSALHNTSSISDSSNSTIKSSRSGEADDDVDDVIAVGAADDDEEECDGNVGDIPGNDDDAENKTRRIKKKTQGDILNAIKIKRLRKQIDDETLSVRSPLVRSCKAARQSDSEKNLESSNFTKLRHVAVRRVPTHLPSKKTSSSSSLNSHLPNKRHSSSKLDASTTTTTCSRARGAAGNVGSASTTADVVEEAAAVTSKVAKKSLRSSAPDVVSKDSTEAASSTSVQTRMRRQTNMRI